MLPGKPGNPERRRVPVSSVGRHYGGRVSKFNATSGFPCPVPAFGRSQRGVMTAIINGPVGLTDMVLDIPLSVTYAHNKGS